MPNQNNKKNGAGTTFTGHALITTLNRACDEAYELYRNLSPDHCVPVMTGCRENRAVVVMQLEPVADGQPDPAVVAAAKSVAKAHQCDCVLMYYPVLISRENDESEPQFGVIVEIQPRGLTATKRLIVIEPNARTSDRPLRKLPVVGRAFGVFYPHLLNSRRAA